MTHSSHGSGSETALLLQTQLATQNPAFSWWKQLLSVALILVNTCLNWLLVWRIALLFVEEEVFSDWLSRCFVVVISSVAELLFFFILIWTSVNACHTGTPSSWQYRLATACGFLFPYARYHVARLKDRGDVPSFLGERVYATIELGIGMFALMAWFKVPEKDVPLRFLIISVICIANSLLVWPIFFYLYKNWQERRTPTDII